MVAVLLGLLDAVPVGLPVLVVGGVVLALSHLETLLMKENEKKRDVEGSLMP
eukprot:CAMPEP_0202337530 /NCGR_PEP_ID=MMETSP1126-20121109/177_1 /ASSEMBLY_ACC=CAM_ASM_000457 /TAXON_ID=3047 /ORGANISM="Dunaliella tertiolecta, Strain CCMP1320" /LENGTH=51 /DNA_ID=CAMNT_0048927743 /DNA_START=434 /DNA_END=588 /DNA_ORIENTATION=+